jgi:hypothetical protein
MLCVVRVRIYSGEEHRENFYGIGLWQRTWTRISGVMGCGIFFGPTYERINGLKEKLCDSSVFRALSVIRTSNTFYSGPCMGQRLGLIPLPLRIHLLGTKLYLRSDDERNSSQQKLPITSSTKRMTVTVSVNVALNGNYRTSLACPPELNILVTTSTASSFIQPPYKDGPS